MTMRKFKSRSNKLRRPTRGPSYEPLQASWSGGGNGWRDGVSSSSGRFRLAEFVLVPSLS